MFSNPKQDFWQTSYRNSCVLLYPSSCELYPSSVCCIHLHFQEHSKANESSLHVLLHYKAVSPLIDEICIYWGIFWWNLHLLRNLPFERSLLIRKLLKSSSWAEEFGYQIHKFLPEIQFVSNSPQLKSTLNFRICRDPRGARLGAPTSPPSRHLCRRPPVDPGNSGMQPEHLGSAGRGPQAGQTGRSRRSARSRRN